MKNVTALFDSSPVREYSKGQIVLYQGERTLEVFEIQSGYIKVYDILASGAEKLLLILGPGDMFPLVWTMHQSEPLHYFYESLDKVSLHVLEKKKMLTAIEKSHAITKELLAYFIQRTQDLMVRLESIEATGAKFKVAQVLTYLAEAHGDVIAKHTHKVHIDITHQAIANMAGIARETASLQLKELEADKAIQFNSNSLIVHSDRLSKILSDDE